MAWVSTKDVVTEQLNAMKQYADIAFATSIDALNQISNEFSSSLVSEQGVDFGNGTAGVIANQPSYIKPTPVPGVPNIEFKQPTSPNIPISPDIIDAKLEAAKNNLLGINVPVFTDRPLALTLPAAPNTALPAAPTDMPLITVPVYPQSPEMLGPEVPILRPIELPTLDPPDLGVVEQLIEDLHNRTPVAPTLPQFDDLGDKLTHYYDLTNGQLQDFVYDCPALKLICPRLGELLSGDSIGMPPAVATQVRDRAFAAEDRQAFQSEQEIQTDWLARGFTLPAGVLDTRLMLVRQLNRDKKSQLNRDLWIEEAKLEIENLRNAIQLGINYETMLRDSWAKMLDAVRAMALAEIDIQIKTLESALSLYKAQVEMWQTEFSTIEIQLRAELAKLEIYKSDLEGQKLIGTLNQQDIEIYKAQWDTINVQASIYKTQVEAANGMLQAELAKIEYAAKQIEIYKAQVEAYETEWKAYGIAADAEKSKTEIFESQSKAFSSRVQAYATQVEAGKSVADLDVQSVKLQIEGWSAQLEQYKAELQTEIERINALIKSGGIESEIYRTKAAVEDGYTSFEIKKLDHFLGVDKLRSDIQLKQLELDQNRELTLAKVALDALDGISRTGAQLSGSAMAAMNVSASISSGSSSSDSYSEVHSYEH